MARLSERWHKLATVAACAAVTACSWGAEPPGVMAMGARNLRCQRSEVETALHRESERVREYYVGCDFMYTRVLCSKADGDCHPAKPQPPSTWSRRAYLPVVIERVER